jgi:hypothetical protein
MSRTKTRRAGASSSSRRPSPAARDISALIAQLEAAKADADTAHTDAACDAAISRWSAAIDGLARRVTTIAGPSPAAVRLPDGSIVAVSIDEFDDDSPGAEPRLFIIRPESVVNV